MLKRFPLYPYLFVLYIILYPLVKNLEQINPLQTLRPLALLLLVTTALLLTFYFFLRNWEYSAYLVFLALLFVFGFGYIYRFIQPWLPEGKIDTLSLMALGIWGSSLIILGHRRIWNHQVDIRATAFLNLVIGLTLLVHGLINLPLLFPAAINLVLENQEQSLLPNTGESLTLDCSRSPDIYYIVMDGYGRSDVLKQIYAVDNSSFIESLEQKGFYIAKQSHTNYIQTVYSIPSALNFDYVPVKPKGVSGYDYFPQMIAKNQVMVLLQQCGYQMVAFETGFFFTNYPKADLYLSAGNGLDEFESLLLANTPLEMLISQFNTEAPERSHETHRQRVLFTFDQLKDLPRINGPKFVLAHIISPHPPFVFDSDGNSVQPSRSYSIADGDDYRGTWTEYREGYAGQVRFVNRMLEETVDAIIDSSPSPPLIIIQGDHGPGGSLDWSSPDKSCLWERSSILNAYYLPNGGRDHLFPSITPVNTFRIVLNTYFGTELELLPDETLFTSHRPGGDFIDITARRDSRDNCK